MILGKLDSFARYAWFVLAYNVVVILWGVFLRASYSGDGCGQHWLTCRGEAIPSAPELKTLIEFSHRVTTMIAGFVVIVLLVWAFRRFEKGHIVRLMATLSFVFILIEGAIGGGLVLTGNTAANWTPTRPLWTAGHLINTFLLVAFLSLTAWFATAGRTALRSMSAKEKLLLATGALLILIVGITGSMAALSNMLFPSESITAGIAKDFDPDSHFLLRLRIFHPLLSIFSAVYLVFLAGWLRSQPHVSPRAAKLAGYVSMIVIAQVIFGAATLLMLGPIVMQLGHLLFADMIWIFFVLLSVSYMTDDAKLK